MTYSIRLPAGPSTVKRARLFVDEFFPKSAIARLDDARLLVSELVTNAVVRAISPVELRISSRGSSTVRVEVWDESRQVPVLMEAPPTAERGRGMAIVDRVADRWGIDQSVDDGKSVWFELET